MKESEKYYCINCGRKLDFVFINGKARMQCGRCSWVMVVKHKSHKRMIIEAYSPP